MAYNNPQPTYQQPAYQQSPYQQQYAPVFPGPVGLRKTNRSLLKFIFLGIITLGIYDIVVMTESTDTVNIIANRYDGRKSTHYCLMYFLFGWLTCGIGWFVWFHNISDRIGNELQRRGHLRSLSASDYWLWCVLGSLIVAGPFIYYYKFFKAMNELSADYNMRG